MLRSSVESSLDLALRLVEHALGAEQLLAEFGILLHMCHMLQIRGLPGGVRLALAHVRVYELGIHCLATHAILDVRAAGTRKRKKDQDRSFPDEEHLP
jgi:hypothetical protein